jgi:3-deoxy-D-manno-octulosonate 8-phosphate phosphatase (KDO 8-P phosphatase)
MNVPKDISVLVLDVDGVLTDGTIAFPQILQTESKSFHVHDGLGISLWQKAGNHTVLISGRNSDCVNHRAKELGIKYIFQGSKDKIKDLDNALAELNATPEQVCFVGDDLGDMAAMEYVGYSIAVQNAVQEVKAIADWTTAKSGGYGAVRDAIEHLMQASGTWETAVELCKTESSKQ